MTVFDRFIAEYHWVPFMAHKRTMYNQFEEVGSQKISYESIFIHNVCCMVLCAK